MKDKKVYIVGIGPGNYNYILPKAIEVLRNSDVIIAFERVKKSIEFINKSIIVVKRLQDIINIIKDNEYKNISIAASGDPNFYGITNYIKNNFNGYIEIIPGITSLQYFTSKLKISWSNAYVGSMHGREEDFINIIKENKVSMWLTDKKNSPNKLCEKLYKIADNFKVYVGENLSYDDERIVVGTVEDIKDMKFSDLTVMIIERI
ncbi:precorrin-6y C5,15-methyltransferase (decarboxylating) subunit CbiE [Clostridium botulinum]|uniref:Precorrin-6y C5,15-methyltransferase (Decarboxylating), CbiE subunit n=1 Tax=Clostridium botulinum D str. 1873 TaxID=592027 RepID=A0A9P2G9D2_CLOBO|nr:MULTISPECIES: precorrin-6y C5,15-methyltransferase (decarboxylating) subunit CbiE [Clostridium]NFV48144.1 precorrin-6y C5,15-methyltransferase (decarboxylating) subunit CbiE [Clostridium botulinum]EES92316.1 precorrin-6y C5,15-methyltransferase (decarboxylating), CbiE subunit [Clostridium botulinum D str. 1873]MBO3442487.1 precorrin-6y C5,15-methyltransferase (decarboxylating) subunit CbiE [Clostridium haemolyticum]MCD3246194.1 precorrin-6y C5,15-methyltransferase (decarboxylating) subunit C